jgi:hypothetical protein
LPTSRRCVACNFQVCSSVRPFVSKCLPICQHIRVWPYLCHLSWDFKIKSQIYSPHQGDVSRATFRSVRPFICLYAHSLANCCPFVSIFVSWPYRCNLSWNFKIIPQIYSPHQDDVSRATFRSVHPHTLPLGGKTVAAPSNQIWQFDYVVYAMKLTTAIAGKLVLLCDE